MDAALKSLLITRYETGDQGTFSNFVFGNNNLFCTELPWLSNETRKSCIPEGKYLANYWKSPKFGLVYKLKDVPGRSLILIHSGNFGGNAAKDWDTHLAGCIAPATKIGTLVNSKRKNQKAGLSSVAAFNKFMDWANKEDVEITITCANSCSTMKI